MTRVLASVGAAIIAFVSIAGCESAIVGSECRVPLVRCGRYCVDLHTDGPNCGTCGNACALGCSGGVCVRNDAGASDGGRDGGHDAGHDGGTDAGPPEDGGHDGGLDAGHDAGDVDGGGPRCGAGELLCSGVCVDGRDGDHCGDCATACTGTDVCLGGACAPDCGALTACGTRCVDTTRDPHHCGDCATDCGGDACVASACTSSPTGHVILVGHDLETRRIQMSTILANAVLLPGGAPTRVLAYEGDATAAAISGTNAGLAEAAGARTYDLEVASADEVLVALDEADTLLVYAQTNASDDTLRSLGYAWRDGLASFLERGGVVVVMEAPSLGNGGTYQILDVAGLFHATAISELVTPHLDAVTARASDPLLAGVVFPYSGERHTVRISSLDPDAIVTTGSASVVFHRTVP